MPSTKLQQVYTDPNTGLIPVNLLPFGSSGSTTSETRIVTTLTGTQTTVALDALVIPVGYNGTVNLINITTGEIWRRVAGLATWDKLKETGGFSKYIIIPLNFDIGTMVNGAVYPRFGTGAIDFATLPISERYTLEAFKAQYKPVEVLARLVNSTAAPMTFDLTLGTTAIPTINVTYSPTLVSYFIPVPNQIPTTSAKTQVGILGNHLEKGLEAYIIYEFVSL